MVGGLFQANNKNSMLGHGRDLAVRLERVSVNTNVKEILDYSCALFDSEGGFVANGTCLLVPT